MHESSFFNRLCVGSLWLTIPSRNRCMLATYAAAPMMHRVLNVPENYDELMFRAAGRNLPGGTRQSLVGEFASQTPDIGICWLRSGRGLTIRGPQQHQNTGPKPPQEPKGPQCPPFGIHVMVAESCAKAQDRAEAVLPKCLIRFLSLFC